MPDHKTARIRLAVSPTEKKKIFSAAHQNEISLSEFIRRAAMKAVANE